MHLTSINALSASYDFDQGPPVLHVTIWVENIQIPVYQCKN